MNDDARRRFAFHLEAMANSTSQFDLNEARRGAGTVAKDIGLSFDQALRAHRAGWPVKNETDGDDEADDPTAPIVRLPRRGTRGGAYDKR